MDENGNGNESWTKREYWRKKLGDNLFILGNLVAGSLVVSQLLNFRINWPVFSFGVFATVLLYGSAILTLKR